jgi:predicted RecB family nuclease
VQLIDGRFVYAASDLNNFLECPHLSELSRLVSLGELPRPPVRDGSGLLQRKGMEHERRFLAALKQRGFDVFELPERIDDRSLAGLAAAEAATRAAMDGGHLYIYQATFFDGTFQGRADFLRRIPDARSPNGYSYEVVDTKLARSTKAYFLIQLCAYSEHVARLQDGLAPQNMVVALGSGEERTFSVSDYLAYFRRLRQTFLDRIDSLQAYPYGCSHCLICDWDDTCQGRRRDDDHLSLVAWMRRDQIAKLAKAGISTVAELGRANGAVEPKGLNPTTFANLKQQARLQLMQRESIARGAAGADRYHVELLPSDPKRGFALLPQPDDGDVYFDMEGDPYYAPDTGLEYLFGVYIPSEDRYQAYWALSLAQEKRALREFLGFLLERRRRYPKMHVYHYAAYEKTALGRLTTRYKVLIDEFDDLLRAGVLVDLYTVVRQGMRISQESYSIKKLEPFYGFHRDAELKRGDDSILLFEDWLDLQEESTLEKIRHYNDEDCRSTFHLHNWLLQRREQLVREQGVDLAWFAPEPPKPPSEEQQRENQEARELGARVLDGMTAPGDLAALAALSDEDRLRWYVANVVDYHRSEAKPSWWEYFQRCTDADQLAEFDHKCIGDLSLRLDVAPYKRAPRDRNLVYTYSFPDQQHGLEPGDEVHDAYTKSSAGELISVSDEDLTLELKRPNHLDHAALRALVPKPFSSGPQQKALADVAQHYLAGTLQHAYPAIVDMVLACGPRLSDRPAGARIQPESVDGTSLAATILALDRSYLVVQGPPGTGKSSTGGHAIVELLKQHKRIGVLARSHKAAQNLVAAVETAAAKCGYTFQGAHKYSKDVDRYQSPFGDRSAVANENDADGALSSHYRLVSGTPWLFALDAAANAFDVLIVDEAGQLSIADAVACARAAPNIVLLGDPLQLAQVSQAKHPPGFGLSILEHLLGSHTTVPEDRGIFLPASWRMHPTICSFISDAVYNGRLQAAAGNEVNAIHTAGSVVSGLRWVPVDHANNPRSSEEEAEAIVREVRALIGGEYRTRTDPLQPITEQHILVVSPYNAQRVLVRQRLRAAGYGGIEVGTVDKFQGLQAPVVIYSMATSSGDDLPRDMQFLFEKNRFNVAISRAQCLSILVCSPRLLEIRCKTPEQMTLVNLLCSYVAAAESANAAQPRRQSRSPSVTLDD